MWHREADQGKMTPSVPPPPVTMARFDASSRSMTRWDLMTAELPAPHAARDLGAAGRPEVPRAGERSRDEPADAEGPRFPAPAARADPGEAGRGHRRRPDRGHPSAGRPRLHRAPRRGVVLLPA